MMLMAAMEVRGGGMTVGDFVLVNTYMIQLYMPLNWLGTVYREIKQSLIDMEQMFRLLGVPQEVADRPGARPIRLAGAEVRFETVGFGYDARRPILEHHLIHKIGDGRGHAEPGRELVGHLGGLDALGDHAHLGHDGLERLSFAEREPDTAIA